jgi:hypothetical protein
MVLATLSAALLASCGTKDENEPVAFVADRVITKQQLDQALEHLEEEAKREQRTPELGAPEDPRTRNRVLVVLVYRAALEEGAERLGIRVTEEQVEAHLQRRGDEDPDEEGDEFAAASARADLLFGAIFRRFTRNVRVKPAQIAGYYRTHRSSFAGRPLSKVRDDIRRRLLRERRNETMHRWVLENNRRLAAQIRYAPGYAPIE